MSHTVLLQRHLPVRHEVDVFVAGGGPAGCAAAVTAARAGASVFLAEAHTCLGGMGTAALVPMFCSLTDGVNFVADGFGREVYERLWEAGGIGPTMRRDRPHGGVLFHAEPLKRVYDSLLEEAGVQFTYQTQLIAVETAGERVSHVVCAAKSGLFAVRARIYVDATGDGDLAAWAGAPFELGDEHGETQAGTLCSLWAGIDWDAVRAGGSQSARLAEAYRDGVFTHPDPHLPGMFQVTRLLGGGNIGHTYGVDGTDERSLTAALVWGRRLVLEYQRYYREYLRGFEQMELATTGSLLGVRETRRVLGDYVLCLNDYRARASFADEIGRFAYPVDIHSSRPEPEGTSKTEAMLHELRYERGESYGIPYRTLTPRGLDNVLVAGRCVSADRYLQGSLRVMPGCYITGQAAGLAAAMAAERRGGTRAVPVPELRDRLRAIGAYLP